MICFFSFLIFTAPGDKAFFQADRRSDRVKKWRVPKDTAVPLGLPEETPKKPLQPALEETSHKIQEEERGPDKLEVPPRKDLKVLLSKSSKLCMKFSHYFTPCIFYLKLFFYIRFRTKRGAQMNWKYHPRTFIQKHC